MLETTHPHLPAQGQPAHVASAQVGSTASGAIFLASQRTLRRSLAAIALALSAAFTGAQAHAQALPTASRTLDIQAGAGWARTSSDYVPEKLHGLVAWGDFDFRSHIGIELNFKQANDPTPHATFYERSYEIGPRFMKHYGRFTPFVTPYYGRGVIQGPPGNTFNLAYNMWAISGGTDIYIAHSISARAAYEHQSWPGFVHGLTPNIIYFGAAYHFH